MASFHGTIWKCSSNWTTFMLEASLHFQLLKSYKHFFKWAPQGRLMASFHDTMWKCTSRQTNLYWSSIALSMTESLQFDKVANTHSSPQTTSSPQTPYLLMSCWYSTVVSATGLRSLGQVVESSPSFIFLFDKNCTAFFFKRRRCIAPPCTALLHRLYRT
jgi:hypothetical protein